MAEANLPSTEDITSLDKSTILINCIVCNKSRCYTKYRRHLQSHVKDGELQAKNVNEIMFSCRSTRCDLKKVYSHSQTQRGYMCHYLTELDGVCGHIVVDLKRHLVTMHNLNRCCSLFEDLVEKGLNEKPVKRKLDHTTLVNIDTRKRFSSSHEASHSMANIRLESKSTHSSSVSAETLAATDVYNLGYESESSDDCAFECSSIPHQEHLDTLTPYPPPPASSGPPPTLTPYRMSDATHVSLQFLDTERIIQEFNTFMLTKGGGGRRNTPIKGDICSFRCLVKEIGWENFWDQNALNRYVSLATCSPSTTYGRLRVYERFVHFLRTKFPFLLPPRESMQAIESMLGALKEALGKDRHVRSKATMTASRERMPHSLDVLRKWRSRRESVEVKKLFPSSTVESSSSRLDEGLFVQLRNYLIVEIILANAQRSGIVEGMLVGEVLKANNNANKENLHYIYVEQHKTGYIQPAIIYLTTEVFNYLVLFVTVILPELPAIGHVRSGDDCHVFQTWLSDCLHTSNVSNCLRNGLKLYGIDDPDGCPTHYRKAASTLISMHKPELQESLSQFMCHSRSTTERHYRHHMAHRGLYSTFSALASCQAMPGEEPPKITHPSTQAHFILLSPLMKRTTMTMLAIILISTQTILLHLSMFVPLGTAPSQILRVSILS